VFSNASTRGGFWLLLGVTLVGTLINLPLPMHARTHTLSLFLSLTVFCVVHAEVI
jgi:hypothetical protein